MSIDARRIASGGACDAFELADESFEASSDALERWIPPAHTVPPPVGSAGFGIDTMRSAVAAALDEAESAIGDDEDLVRRGLDSVGIMTLAGEWRRAGIKLKFAAMLDTPTLSAWSSLAADGATRVPESPAAVVDERAPFPLTPVQLAYWVGRADGRPLGGVGCHFYAEVDGRSLETARLERAVRALIARHPMLRARFNDDGSQQILDRSAWAGLIVRDLRPLSADGAEEALTAVRDRLSHRRLEVQRGETFDLSVSLLAGERTRLHFNIDLLVADVLSIRIILDDLAALYASPDGVLEPLQYSFSRYLATQAAAGGETRTQAMTYWQERTGELPLGPRLPLAAEPERIGRPRFTRRDYQISGADRERLSQRARAKGLTLPMALAAAFVEVLGAWSEAPRFLLNLPLFDREMIDAQVGSLVADFTNLILVDVDVSEAGSFAERAGRLQARFRADVAHSGYSGVEVLRDLARIHGATATAPVVFTSAIGIGELFSAGVRDAFGSPGWMLSQTPQVWLDHQVVEHAGGLLLNWDAVEELFPPGMLDAMFGAYVGLVGWLGASETDWDTAVPALLPPAQAAVRALVNGTSAPQSDGLLHEAFFARATASPERLAVGWGLASLWSYGELADRALRLGALLIARGVKPGEAVAVTLPKSPDQIAAVLGVLACGAVYVPVGADQPLERRRRIYANAGARFVLSSASSAVPFPADLDVLAVEQAQHVAPLPQPLRVPAEALAYVIYTSGSTGEPKGVEIAHRAAVNTIEDVNGRFGVNEHDRVLAVSALDFDLSVYDVFGLLAAGGAVILIEEHERREARAWIELIKRWNVTLWNTVPALLEMLLAAAGPELVSAGLRLALVSGDWVGLDLPARMREQLPGARLIALGGATEASIWSNAFEVGELEPQWRSIPYGYPLRNQRFRVVDALGRDCPDWVAGELWIGGSGVAQGYRGAPELSARAFVTAADSGRWYRTGDLGRYWPAGTLEFLGRRDQQIKIGGHRIELGEIEAALNAHPDVANAVIVTVGEKSKRLAGAVLLRAVPASGGGAEPALRDWLATRVPAHMVPERLTVLDELPLSANGKVDRKAIALLLGEDRRAQPAAFNAPIGPLETAVAGLWAELLGTERVGREESFFALGGDSLIATRVVVGLRRLGIGGAELARLFATPVLAEFAATLFYDAHTVVSAPRLVADPLRRHEPFGLTDVQHAYWMGRRDDFVLGGVGCHYYTEFDGASVDLGRLEAAWNGLIARHEMLRAVIDPDGRQRILPVVPALQIPVVDAGGFDEPVALAEMRGAMSHQVIELASWPLFDVRAVRYGAGRTRIGVSLDNAALDAYSCAIVFDELERLYADPRAVLPPVGDVSFRDYVIAVAADSPGRQAAQRYWSERIADLPPPPDLPLRIAAGAVVRPHFTRLEAFVEPAVWRTIAERARAANLTSSSVLATAFAEVLGAWSGRSDLTLNLTLFDRRDVHPQIGAVLGDFTSLLLVEYRPAAGETWRARARRLQQQVSRDLEHSEVSAVWVLRELSRRSGREVMMPVVFTSTLGAPGASAAPRTPFAERVWGVSQTPQVWLDHQVVEHKGGLLLNWDAVEELFAPGMLDAMFEAYVGLVGWLGAPQTDWDTAVPALLPPAQAAVRALVRQTSAGQAAGGDRGSVDQAEPARGPVEAALALIWAEFLALDPGTIGRNASFIGLGGDSLMATRMVEAIRHRLGVTLSLRQLFATPTIAELAVELGRAAPEEFEEDAV
jgi:yersiniabactin nonribosomal peptide synthetase